MSKRYRHDGRGRPGTIWRYLAVALLFFEIAPAQAQALSPGDILVTDFDAGRNFRGVLFRVDPVSGVRTPLSNFGNPAQGPLGAGPLGVALEATGDILVIDFDAGRNFRGGLFRVNPVSGVRRLLSDFGNPAQGPRGVEPVGVALESTGAILVTDEDAGRRRRGVLFRVDPVTGARTRVSTFSDPAQGPRGLDPVGIALQATGTALVSDFNAGRDRRGVLFRVDPVSGVRTRLSDFDEPALGPLGQFPFGVAIEATGAILVIDRSAGRQRRGVLFRVGPVSGARTRVSNFGNPAQGPRGREPGGVAVVPP